MNLSWRKSIVPLYCSLYSRVFFTYRKQVWDTCNPYHRDGIPTFLRRRLRLASVSKQGLGISGFTGFAGFNPPYGTGLVPAYARDL